MKTSASPDLSKEQSPVAAAAMDWQKDPKPREIPRFPNGLFRNRSLGALDIASRPEATMVTVSQKLGATPAGEFSWRAPSPPHIHIPPGPEDGQLILPQPHGIDGEDNTTTEILSRLPQTQVDKTKDWKYEWRREAQAILSFLYLGPSSGARNVEELRKEGITMLLVIRNTMTAQASLLSGDKVAKQLGIKAAAVDVAGNPELIAAFPRAVKIINDHLISIDNATEGTNSTQKTFGKILVFCESGNERSAAVVAAYLMSTYDLNLVQAIQYIQSQRFCVAFDDALKNLLLNYQQLLEAKKSVSASFNAIVAPSGEAKSGIKRGRDDMVDEDIMDVDMDLDYADDEERFGNRANFVPFYDGSLI